MSAQELIRRKILLMDEELKFLRYFYEVAGYAMGPADMDIYDGIKQDYLERHGSLPTGYEFPDDEE